MRKRKLLQRDSKGRFCSSYKIPKLTTEVFNRPDCPKWAQWAAVDKCGLAYFFENKPAFGGSRWHDLKYGMYDQIPGGFYDTSNCEHSLIERPKKELEKGIYYSPSAKLYYRLGEISFFNSGHQAFVIGSFSRFEDLPEDAHKVCTEHYTPEELIGKLVKSVHGYYTITYAAKDDFRLGAFDIQVHLQDLENCYTFKDGSPCFKVLPQ